MASGDRLEERAGEGGDGPDELSDPGLADLYGAVARHRGPLVVAHLGQSLDGRIALRSGASRWITGPEDVTHNHRMRALFQAVLVGRGTIENDDPQLTVRLVDGPSPCRIVVDLNGRLGPGYRIFRDDDAPTLLVRCRGCGSGTVGRAEILEIDAVPAAVTPRTIVDALAARGLTRLFVEGGGVTISRFLAAGCLDRLQITIAPVILGSGRPGIALPPIDDMEATRRHPYRRFTLGDDVLIELDLRG